MPPAEVPRELQGFLLGITIYRIVRPLCFRQFSRIQVFFTFFIVQVVTGSGCAVPLPLALNCAIVN